MIGVGVGRDDHLAAGQVEVHLANQFHNLVNGFHVTDIDQQELAAAVDEVDIDPQPAPRLVVHLDDVGEKVFAA